MILHLFTQVSDYSIEFIKMMLNNFDMQEHIIVFRSRAKEQEIKAIYPDVLFVTTRHELISNLSPLIKKSKRILFHSFPVSRSLFFWLYHMQSMQKAVWSVWGQDAYWYQYCKKTPENWLFEMIRKLLIKRLDKVFCPVYNDYLYIKKHYRTCAQYIHGMYPIPTDFERLRLHRNYQKGSDCIHIQIGNSANPTNNTLEILQILASYPTKNFRIFCPVSYGDDEYADKVIKLGTELFGERFTGIRFFMDRIQYAEFIAGIDILIMNHQRQQGLGNIFSYLYLGKKVYIRSDNSSFSFFALHDIKVYDTIQLGNSLEIDEMLKMDPLISEVNMKKTEALISSETIVAGWAQILTSI